MSGIAPVLALMLAQTELAPPVSPAPGGLEVSVPARSPQLEIAVSDGVIPTVGSRPPLRFMPPVGLGAKLLGRIRRAGLDQPQRFLALDLDLEHARSAGVTVEAVLGRITAGRATGRVLFALAERSARIEAPQSLRPALDVSLPAARATDLKTRFDVDGEGVLLAAYDSGIDLLHPDFRASDLSRVVRLWDQDSDEICEPDRLQTDRCPARDIFGHGTAVIAAAAGSGEQYRGVAPQADVVVARTNAFEDLAPALAWFRSTAKTRAQPMVINISLGGHEGAHDGTSLDAQAINACPHLVIAAAGNDGDWPVHARTELNPGQPRHVGLALDRAASQTEAIVELWADTPEIHARMVLVQSNAIVSRTSTIGPGDMGRTEVLEVGGLGYGTVELDAEPTAHPINGRYHIRFETRFSGELSSAGLVPAVEVEGRGRFDLWVDAPARAPPAALDASRSLGLDTQLDGDSEFSINDIATASAAIAVSSFISRTQAPNPYGSDYRWPGEAGTISTFSSNGPTLAPARTGDKPEIAAPGESIVSAQSQDATPPGASVSRLYSASSGTSLAVPHVAGAAALLLQAHPDADRETLKAWLLDHAEVPSKNAEDPRWGRGQLDVAATLRAAGVQETGCGCGTAGVMQGRPPAEEAIGLWLLLGLCVLSRPTRARAERPLD